MAGPGGEHPVDQWQAHVVKDLELIARKWRELEEPVAKLKKAFDSAQLGPGKVVPVTDELKDAIEHLNNTIIQCPNYPQPRKQGAC